MASKSWQIKRSRNWLEPAFKHFRQLRRNSKCLGNYYTHSLHASKIKAVHVFALLKCTQCSLPQLFNNCIAKMKLSVGSLTQKYMLSTNTLLIVKRSSEKRKWLSIQVYTTQCKLLTACASGWMKKHHQCKLQLVTTTTCASGTFALLKEGKHQKRKVQRSVCKVQRPEPASSLVGMGYSTTGNHYHDHHHPDTFSTAKMQQSVQLAWGLAWYNCIQLKMASRLHSADNFSMEYAQIHFKLATQMEKTCGNLISSIYRCKLTKFMLATLSYNLGLTRMLKFGKLNILWHMN